MKILVGALVLLAVLMTGTATATKRTQERPPKQKTAEEQLDQSSTEKAKAFIELLNMGAKQSQPDRKIKFTFVRVAFFDEHRLALLHIHVEEKEVPAEEHGMNGEIFYILGRMNSEADWIPMTQFSRPEGKE